MPKDIPRVIVCRCTFRTDVIPQVTRDWLDSFCKGKEVILVDDLCGLAAVSDSILEKFALQSKPVIVACHARAIKSLFVATGHSLPDSTVIVNAKTTSIAEIEKILEAENISNTPECCHVESSDSWIPWYPVIDYERCTNCKQCLNFCLFDAYGQDNDGKVFVKSPHACKTNCPACARICPSVAIVFPKYEESPINGAEIVDEQKQNRRVKIDTQKILGSDVYAALRKRQEKRQLLSQNTRQEQLEKARLEREEWLQKQLENPK